MVTAEREVFMLATIAVTDGVLNLVARFSWHGRFYQPTPKSIIHHKSAPQTNRGHQTSPKPYPIVTTAGSRIAGAWQIRVTNTNVPVKPIGYLLPGQGPTQPSLDGYPAPSTVTRSGSPCLSGRAQ